MKRRRYLIVVIGLILGLTAILMLRREMASQPLEPDAHEPSDNSTVQIGFTFDTFVIERWQRDRDAFIATCQELGAVVDVQNPNGSPQEQASQIRYFIAQEVDVIVIVAIEAEAIREAIKEAQRQGIQVIAYDRLIPEAGTDLYISFDSEAVGRLTAEALIEAKPDGGAVALIKGAPSDHNAYLLAEGFLAGIKDSNFEVIYTADAEEWRAEASYEATDAALAEADRLGVELVGIMCGNDSLAVEAVRRLAEERLAGTVFVTGQDADLTGCQQVVEGSQLMTVYKPVSLLAQAAARQAIRLAKGLEVETETSFDDGRYMIPSLLLEPIAVDSRNMDDVIIRSGFHLEEDVYRYVQDK